MKVNVEVTNSRVRLWDKIVFPETHAAVSIGVRSMSVAGRVRESIGIQRKRTNVSKLKEWATGRIVDKRCKRKAEEGEGRKKRRERAKNKTR